MSCPGWLQEASGNGRLLQPTRAADLKADWQRFPAPAPPLFGLAPGGVCRAVLVAKDAVRSYRTLSPLPPLSESGGRFAFCGTVPGVAPAGGYPAPCFHGARTFLPALYAKMLGGAAIRPADRANKGRSACYVKELLAGHCGARERATMTTRPSICKHGQARNSGGRGHPHRRPLDQRTAETHVAEGVEQRAAPIKSSIYAPLRPWDRAGL